jgi:carbamoyltransferase
MNVLGISCYYHDAAACLVSDGSIIAAAEEERFTRKKHDNRFPEEAIAFCLAKAGMVIADIDAICFYEKPLLKLERILASGRQWAAQSLDLTRYQISQSLNERLFLPQVLFDKLSYSGRVMYVDHHLSHAASAYYISNFASSAILTVDGVGEWATTAQFIAENGVIRKHKEIHYPHSLGLLYSTVTAFLGFKVNNDEYKVMGLASYGKPRFRDKIEKLLTIYTDGSFRLNLKYFSYMYDAKRMYSNDFVELFGQPRVPEAPITQDHIDIASSVQAVLEDVMIRMTTAFQKETRQENICLAGGVALNCVANWRLVQETPFKHFCIQPASGDGGGSMGAALYGYFSSHSYPIRKLQHSTLLGPEFSDEEIEKELKSKDVSFTKVDEQTLCRKTADLIHRNQIVGWFQGRMEFGPRALGNRSILANATNPSMKDILNSRVKFREDFRPFAPAVLQEKANEYFNFPFESPYMLFIAPVKTGKESLIPSVTHTDGTARMQTVSHDDNPRFHRVISEFESLSGIPIVINTSFNIRGEPIVCTPKDAINCFLKTDIDYLIINNFIVEK